MGWGDARQPVPPPQEPLPLITSDEALARILAHVRPLPAREVSLLEALGCFAARDVSASLSLPPFDNSSMDGFAVVARSCARGRRLKLIGEQPAARDRSLSVRPGEAVRIFTGAPLPSGADAVVMQEEAEIAGEEVVLKGEVVPGEFIR